MYFKEPSIYYKKTGIYEYYNLKINKNNKCVLNRYFNMQCYNLDDVIKERDEFLATNAELFEYIKKERLLLRRLGVKL